MGAAVLLGTLGPACFLIHQYRPEWDPLPHYREEKEVTLGPGKYEYGMLEGKFSGPPGFRGGQHIGKYSFEVTSISGGPVQMVVGFLESGPAAHLPDQAMIDIWLKANPEVPPGGYRMVKGDIVAGRTCWIVHNPDPRNPATVRVRFSANKEW